jgi:hypothetical protein
MMVLNSFIAWHGHDGSGPIFYHATHIQAQNGLWCRSTSAGAILVSLRTSKYVLDRLRICE